jgi:predicted acetyltransferase
MAGIARRFPFLPVETLVDGELELHLVRTSDRDESRQFVATYHFEMRVNGTVAGGIRFRAENEFDVEQYAGNLGYNVDPKFRGHHFAERACRLLAPLARAHGFQHLWITCNPDNAASRRTCERLGAVLVEIVELPDGSDMRLKGDRFKCRYRWDLL